MSFLSTVFGGGAKGIIEGIGGIADRFIQTADEKAQFALEVEKVITERMKYIEESARTTVESRMQVIIAELQHGDEYVKHTRPMIARWGLYTIIYNYAGVPTLSGIVKFLLVLITGFSNDPQLWADLVTKINIEPFQLPLAFWGAWGGIVGTYSVGRSFEKFGVRNKWTKAATGNALPEDIATKFMMR